MLEWCLTWANEKLVLSSSLLIKKIIFLSSRNRINYLDDTHLVFILFDKNYGE